VATLDADFHALLVREGAHGPSVIRLRIERPLAPVLTDLLPELLDRCREDLSRRGDDLERRATCPRVKAAARGRREGEAVNSRSAPRRPADRECGPSRSGTSRASPSG
jgi:hypothetical protein